MSLKLRIDPPIEPVTTVPFLQTISLVEAGRTIAALRWHAPSGRDAVLQILDIHVDPDHRRTGLGSRLVAEMLAQAAALAQVREMPHRTLWCVVEHEEHIIFRGFLTRHGFHHVSTSKRLYRGQDALIYARGLD